MYYTKGWVFVFILCIFGLQLYNANASTNQSLTINGTITTSGCHIIGGTITNQTTDMGPMEICQHKNSYFQIKELPPDSICIQVVVYWKDPDTGTVYTFPDPCVAPQFYDSSKGNVTGTQPISTLNTTDNTVSIISIQSKDQQGNQVTSFANGTNGFVNVVLSSHSNQQALVTVDLIGSDLTSLGTGSIKSILSQTAEMTLSFGIPDTVKEGTADICVDAYSDWPDKGGIPLASESCEKVSIGQSALYYNNQTNNTMMIQNTKQSTQHLYPLTTTWLSEPNIIKIKSVGIFPYPLKVGDIARFNVTYQKTSDRPLYHTIGCGSDLWATFSPSSNVKELYDGRMCASGIDAISPNQTLTDVTWSGYQIVRPGLLNVTLTLYLSQSNHDPTATIQFFVNATEQTPTNSALNGTLSGAVYIMGGPAENILKPSPNPGVNYEVDVYNTDGVTIVGKTLSDENAHYTIQLPAGNYIIYTYHLSKQSNFVTVVAGKNTIFNITYDNGMR
jgi:hypothetical protein